MQSIKRIICMMLVCVLSLTMLPTNIITYASTQIDGELGTPTNLKWKEGSLATATWDIVKDANYYVVDVYVFSGSKELGHSETGTASNEIDLQQEIYVISRSESVSTVQVFFTVQAKKIIIQDDTYILGEKSSLSEGITYYLGDKGKFSTPTNLVLNSETYRIKCDCEEDSGHMMIDVRFIDKITGEEVGRDASDTSIEEIKSESGADISWLIQTAYNILGLSGREVYVSCRVYITPTKENVNYSPSDYSEWSNSILYKNEAQKFKTPYNLTLDSDYNAKWNCDENSEGFLLDVRYTDAEGNELTTNRTGSGTDEPGIGYFNILFLIQSDYGRMGLESETVYVSYKVCSYPGKNDNYLMSDFSEWSNAVPYSEANQPRIKYNTPTNVTLDPETFYAKWDYDERSESFDVDVRIVPVETDYETVDENFSYDTTGIGGPEQLTANGYDLLWYIKLLYLSQDNDPIPVYVSYRVRSSASKGSEYKASDNSEWSDFVLYNPHNYPLVESIDLSPTEPIVSTSGSIHIGKVINPADAYYRYINWTAEDSSIATVDSEGKVSGIKPGTTTVKASIGKVSASVPVTVYALQSNIEDAESNQEVKTEANDVISAIVSGEEVDNADIEDPDNVNEMVHEGAKTDDGFSVDMGVTEKDKEEYSEYWDDIEKEMGNYQYGCGFDVNIGIYYRDLFGLVHRVCYITQFDNEIRYRLTPYGLPALLQNYQRNYVLIRIHDGKVEKIPVTLNRDGTVEVKSDKFSDFILAYEDVKADDTVQKYTVTFNSNEGSAVEKQEIVSGGTVVKPADPTREGYTFAGWYSDSALTVAYDFSQVVTGNLSLYAKWTKNADDSTNSGSSTRGGGSGGGGGGGGGVAPAKTTTTKTTTTTGTDSSKITTSENKDGSVTKITVYDNGTSKEVTTGKYDNYTSKISVKKNADGKVTSASAKVTVASSKLKKVNLLSLAKKVYKTAEKKDATVSLSITKGGKTVGKVKFNTKILRENKKVVIKKGKTVIKKVSVKSLGKALTKLKKGTYKIVKK